MKGHNYGLCRNCGKIHIHPQGMLGKFGLQTGPKGYKFPNRENSKGSKNGMFGKHHTEEAKKRIGEKNKLANKNKKRSDQQREHYSLGIRKSWSDPESKERRIAGIRKVCKTQSYRDNLSRSLIGRESWLKGKTYEEIFGTKDKAERRKQKTSNWMKSEKNIRRFCKHPSKTQIKLFEIVKQKYPTAVMEYPVRIDENKTIWLDIAVVECKLNFEFDGRYWHQNRKEEDKMRDKILEMIGWKIFRFTEIPIKEICICA